MNETTKFAFWVGDNDTECSKCGFKAISRNHVSPYCPFCGKTMINYAEIVLESDDNGCVKIEIEGEKAKKWIKYYETATEEAKK